MASAPVRFRCGQCKQLIGVSRSKAGTVVTCPRCQARLVAPEPDDDHQGAPVASSSALSPSPISTEAGARSGSASFDDLDLRVEDIQVEPGVRHLYPTSEAAATPEDVPGEVEVPPAPSNSDQRPEVAPVAYVPTPAPAPLVPPGPPPAVLPQVEPPVLPGLQLDTSERPARPKRAESPRSPDLVVPRGVVGAWSLLVLLAVGFAFVAGLLAGHFLWGVH